MSSRAGDKRRPRPFPTLEQTLSILAEICEVPSVDPDTPVRLLDVDSLDLMEWTFVLREEHDVVLEDEDLVGLNEAMTLRELYGAVRDMRA